MGKIKDFIKTSPVFTGVMALCIIVDMLAVGLIINAFMRPDPELAVNGTRIDNAGQMQDILDVNEKALELDVLNDDTPAFGDIEE